MAMQQTNSSFSKRLGARVAAANAEHKDKPIDTGIRRLPAGIKSGIAKLQFAYTKEQTEDKKDAKIPKGEHFFRASASVLGQILNGPHGPVLVKDHNGENIESLTTQVIIPLCDEPAKGERKGKTFSENWYAFQNLFKLLSNGAIVCPETQQSDPTGQKTEHFYFAIMDLLTNPKHPHYKPVYVEFSTREWTPPATTQQPKPEPMVFETWHGLAQLPSNGQFNPAAGVTETHAARPTDSPPAQTQAAPARAAAPPPPTNGPPPQHQPDDDEEAEISALVEVALADPDGETPDGAAASQQLEEMAWARGWTKEQTGNAKDWAEVGSMALSDQKTEQLLKDALGVTVGGKWMYAKRTKDGAKYKNSKGEEFPPQECEVVSVNAEAKTCTLKTCHDGKDVTDIRTKKPVDVKFEWLEQAPPY